MNGLEAHGRHVVSQFAGGSIGSGASGANGMNPMNVLYFVFFLLILLFLLVPAINLSGLNASHMQDRIAELGVRKAFGARRTGLFMQILIENMVLMLPGGLVGLLFSYLLILLVRGLLLVPGVCVMVTGGANAEPSGLRGCLFGLLGAQLPVVVDTGLACRTGEYNRCYKQLNGEMPCLNIYSN